MTIRLVLAAAIVAITAVSAHAAEPSFSIAGKWDSDFGQMEVTESGGSVTGSYPVEDGKIVGTLSGSRLTGQWIQGRSARRCDNAVNDSYFHG